MYNDRRKKIIRISLIVVGVIIIVLVYLFIKNKQEAGKTTETKGNFFLDLGSLITGKRQSPNGASLIPNSDGLGNSNNGDLGTNNTTGSGSAFVSGGLPEPTPIAQNIGGGFGTNNRDLFPDGENPNNCIGCSNITPEELPVDPKEVVDSYVYINAVPSAIHKDDEVTVTWDSSNVNACFATSFPAAPGWNGSISKSGVKYFSLNKPTTFIIKCSTTSGAVQASDSVSVLADDVPLCKEDNTCFLGDGDTSKYVSVVMEASPYIVESGGTSLLAWDTENTTMCNANSVPLRDDWKGLVPQRAGETDIILPNTPVTYILTCTDGKTTGQTDVTISIDTSLIDDGRGFGDDPIDLCSRSGQETNPLCLVRDISIDEEERVLILTDKEQAILDSLMKEVAIMSPTLPSNQTSSNLNISTQSYKNILSNINVDLDACYALNKNPKYTDAAFERRIAGRRDPIDNASYLIEKYGWITPSKSLLDRYKAIPDWSWGKPCIKERDYVPTAANTFVLSELYTTCYLAYGNKEGHIGGDGDNKDLADREPNYEKAPHYERMKIEVEFKAWNEFKIMFK